MESFRDYLVTDRTEADVLSRNEKGTYHASDLNRVTRAALYLLTRLWEYGAGAEPERRAYLVTAAASPRQGGSAGGGVYFLGEEAALRAVPARGYDFAGWQEAGEVFSREPELRFPVSGGRTLTAVFQAQSGPELGVVGLGEIGRARIGKGGV